MCGGTDSYKYVQAPYVEGHLIRYKIRQAPTMWRGGGAIECIKIRQAPLCGGALASY